MFIAVDGIDGAGKTTLVKHLAKLLRYFNPLCTKEPTNDSVWGRRLRNSAVHGRLDRAAELEFFHKDRLQHIANVIKPALMNHRIVLCDRYIDSTLAFQSATPKEADELYGRVVSEILIPDVTFILDCTVDLGLFRIGKSRASFSTFETYETLERAHQIYASRAGQTYVHLDAAGLPEMTLKGAYHALLKHNPDMVRLALSYLNTSENWDDVQRLSAAG